MEKSFVWEARNDQRGGKIKLQGFSAPKTVLALFAAS